MILLLKLHRYGHERAEFKDKMVFYPCGKLNAEDELDDASRLFRIIGYSCYVGDSGFLQTVGRFLSGAYLSGAYLSGANLSGANLSRANLSGANLSGAFSDVKWNGNTKWENVRGLDAAVNVPAVLRQQLGMQ